MRTIFTTLTPEATFAVMVISLIVLALLTPLVYRKIQQVRLRRMYARELAEATRRLAAERRAQKALSFGLLYGQDYKSLERRWG